MDEPVRSPDTSPEHAKGGAGAENTMVLVTSLVVAFVMMDRLAVGFIAPYLVVDLQVNVTSVGLLYSVQALATAVSGIALGRYSDKSGRRRSVVAWLLVAGALIAPFALIVGQYGQLVVLRLLMGLLVGGLTPIIQSIVSIQSTPNRLGRNLGIQMLLLFLVGQMAGPLLTTSIAEAFGWRTAYAAFALPLALLAASVFWLVREVQPRAPQPAQSVSPAAAEGRGDPVTIAVAMVISAGFMMCLVVHTTFLSLYLVEEHGLSPVSAGRMVSVLGIAGAAGGILLPVLSDKVGLRPTLALAMALMGLIPFAALSGLDSIWTLQVFFFLGYLCTGSLPIYSVLLPQEASPPARIAANIALVIGVGEVVGGIGGPLLGGQLADRLGLKGPFILTAAVSALCLLLALWLLWRGTAARRPATAV